MGMLMRRNRKKAEIKEAPKVEKPVEAPKVEVKEEPKVEAKPAKGKKK